MLYAPLLGNGGAHYTRTVALTTPNSHPDLSSLAVSPLLVQ